MTVPSVLSSTSQSVGAQILQSLLAGSGGSSDTSGLSSSALGDLLSLSSASRQLSKAPAAVTAAVSDLFGAQKDVQGDLTQLKGYFKDNPDSLSNVLATLQGGSATYGASGQTSNSALLSALLSGQTSGSSSTALLSALMGSQTQDPLLASLGSDSGSGTVSLFG